MNKIKPIKQKSKSLSDEQLVKKEVEAMNLQTIFEVKCAFREVWKKYMNNNPNIHIYFIIDSLADQFEYFIDVILYILILQKSSITIHFAFCKHSCPVITKQQETNVSH